MELISAAFCLPISHDCIPDGGIVTDNGRIVAVGTTAALQARYPGIPHQHHDNAVLMPGLVNAHLHVDLARFTCEPPQAADTVLATSPHVFWLKRAMEERQRIRIDDTIESIQQCLDRLVKYGVTCVGAMTNYDGAWSLVEGSGLRAVIFPELYGGGPLGLAQDRFESTLAMLEECDRARDRVRLGFGPLAPYLLSRPLLQIISHHARSDTIPLQLHVAESFDEMEFFYNSSGPIGTEIFPLLGWGDASDQPLPPPFRKTPVHYLEEIGLLEARPSLVGCVQLSGTDIPMLKRRGCRVVFSPRAVQAFGLGHFPYGKLVEEGITVGLGTESLFESTDGDLWHEMRAALQTGGISPHEILAMATTGGAAALGWDDDTGTLAEGKQADYILVDLPPLSSPDDLADALIRHTTAQHVRQTVVGGQSLKHA